MEILKNTLYLVGTPIGNLSDLSPRAAQVLSEVDFIAAEDTRVTAKLLSHLGVKKPMISYHEHNKRERGEIIVEKILAGETCALVSDAGMPAISDPGEDLVRLCNEKDITVSPVPGPSALIAALCASGIETGRFTFEGFLTTAPFRRREHLSELTHEKRTMIFYEAPHKLYKTLRDMSKVFGPERKVTLARELTKIYEQFIRTDLGSAADMFRDRDPKGEFVLIIEGEKENESEERDKLEYAKEIIERELSQGASKKSAVEEAVRLTGIKKNDAKKLADY